MIYLDSSATSLYKPPQVAKAVAEAINTMGNTARGLYGPALAASREVFLTRELLANLFGAEGPEQIVFTANATESLNMAIKGLLEPGDMAVTTVMEHNSVLRPLYEMEEKGVSLKIVGTDETGRLDMDEMEKAIEAGPKAVFCTHASNLTGNVNDIGQIGLWCHKADVFFVVDGAQTAGTFPVNMERDFIDIFCFTGHKSLFGPQGTGGLCVGTGVMLKPLVTGGSGIRTFDRHHPQMMPEALEAGTLNGHGIAGLRAGIEYVDAVGMDSIREREQALADRFYHQAGEIKDIQIYGDFTTKNRAPIVSLNLGDEDSGQVADWLFSKFGICVRAGGHCAPLMHSRFGTEEQGMVRFSFSCFNQEGDVDTAIKALKAY